jgi:Asp-tRNA(Asn)/Glu-tRNA(Gln) amidotransferase A subunit family amidase
LGLKSRPKSTHFSTGVDTLVDGIRDFVSLSGGNSASTTRQNPKIVAASLLPSAHPDLHQAREGLKSFRTTPVAEIERSIEIASSAACRDAFLRTSFDEARRSASDPAALQRPLMGLAVSVKDLFDVHGEVTAAGSVALADAPPAAQDCPAVARLRAAGAAILGRTNMTEFAFSGVGTNPHFGTPANPADTQTPRIPGGSSSGAAVSVASGAAFIGLGSDTGGSIRIPAALTGIVGFKSTARLVPADRAVPLSTTLDTVCAMTRSVRDAILAHEVLAGRTVTIVDAPLAGYRLAVARTAMLDALDGTVARAFDRALKTLRDAGAAIEEIELAAIRDLGSIQSTGGFSAAESYAWHRQLLATAGDRYDPRVRTRIERGAGMKAFEYIDLINARREWIARVIDSLRGFDAVLSPTVPIVAPPIAQVAPGAQRDDEFFRVNALLLRNTSVVNMLDGCAISIPCHAPGELPVGLMIWQSAMHDDTVLSIARQAEAALAIGELANGEQQR